MCGQPSKVYRSGKVPLKLLQWNCLSMVDPNNRQNRPGFKDEIRRSALAAEMHEAGIVLAGFQETRTSQISFSSEHYIHICSGAMESNHSLGCEFWCAKYLGTGDKKINVSDIEKFFSVLICTPRTLLVAVKTPVVTLHALVIHAPWSAKPSSLTDAIRKKIDDFWDELFVKLRQFPSLSSFPLIVFADMNARLGLVENKVGAIRDDTTDYQGNRLCELLNMFSLAVPQTFEGIHDSGPTHTLIKAGTTNRIDFICVPESWMSRAVKAGIMQDITLIHEGDDHLPVYLEICKVDPVPMHWQAKRKAAYELEIIKEICCKEHDAPEKIALLDEINKTVDMVPEFVAPIDLSVCVNDATARIREILCKAAPVRPSKPNSPAMFHVTYSMLKERNMYRAKLRACNAAIDHASLWTAFKALSSQDGFICVDTCMRTIS